MFVNLNVFHVIPSLCWQLSKLYDSINSIRCCEKEKKNIPRISKRDFQSEGTPDDICGFIIITIAKRQSYLTKKKKKIERAAKIQDSQTYIYIETS